jgi:monovalent cation:H+ antiporter-2, CPA2 family
MSLQELVLATMTVLVKFFILIGLLFTIGNKIVAFIMSKIVLTHSHELFTLTMLAVTFLIATGASYLFGTSIALGAFIAGMMMGQTNVRRQVSSNSMPLRDAFIVIFFLSVGMLFNPKTIFDNFFLFLGILAIILILKPLVAYLIVILLKHPLKTALTVAVALAQIGEFSFILAEEAMKFNILPEDGYDIIVACALISIAINPLLFKLIDLYKPHHSNP